MEKQGLIRRVKDLGRRNLVRIVLTEKGNEAYKNMSECNSINEAFSAIDNESFQQLKSYLRTIRDSVLRELGQREEPSIY